MNTRTEVIISKIVSAEVEFIIIAMLTTCMISRFVSKYLVLKTCENVIHEQAGYNAWSQWSVVFSLLRSESITNSVARLHFIPARLTYNFKNVLYLLQKLSWGRAAAKF